MFLAGQMKYAKEMEYILTRCDVKQRDAQETHSREEDQTLKFQSHSWRKGLFGGMIFFLGAVGMLSGPTFPLLKFLVCSLLLASAYLGFRQPSAYGLDKG